MCELLKVKSQVDLPFAHDEPSKALTLIDRTSGNEVELDYFISEALVSGKLQISLKQEDRATQAVTKRLRASNDEQPKEPAASFLCLGVMPNSKKQYAESLGKNLVMDVWFKLTYHNAEKQDRFTSEFLIFCKLC